MRTIRTIIGSIIVYLCVAMIQACGSTSPRMAGGGGSHGGGGSGGHGGSIVADANADQSGMRIEVVYQLGDDGSKIQARFYDTMRKEYCDTYAASDGRNHCMPAIGPTVALSASYFSDSGCSVSVGYHLSCYGAPKYILVTLGAGGCASYYKTYVAGAAIDPSAPIYIGAPGSCLMTTQAVGSSYYSIGAEVSPSAFVGFTPQTP